MSRIRNITLQAPLGGVNRRVGFQSQPPYTAYDALNYWPFQAGDLTDSIGQGERRVPSPRLVLSTGVGTIGGSGNINLLERVNGVASGKPLQSLLVARGGTYYWYNSSGSFTAATGAQATSAETDVSLYGRTFLQKTYVPSFGNTPHEFDYAAGTVATATATAGTWPTDVRMFEVWQGALWAAGALASPQVLYASRIGDAEDWDFSVPISDEGGAFFTAGEDEGRLRGAVTAIMPQTADTMIVSTLEGLVAMRGHPRLGGTFEDIGGTYVFGQGAWCRGPDDTLYMMTSLGLMSLSPAPNAVPVRVSKEVLPTDLLGLNYDYEDPTLQMAYDSRFDGIIITNRGTAAAAFSYWFDIATGGFWPLEFSEDSPYRIIDFEPQIGFTGSGLILASDQMRKFEKPLFI